MINPYSRMGTIAAPEEKPQQPRPVISSGPDPAQRELINAMVGRQLSSLPQSRNWQEAVGNALPLYAGLYRQNQMKKEADVRNQQLSEMLSGATDRSAVMDFLIQSGDPRYVELAIQERLKPPAASQRQTVSPGQTVIDPATGEEIYSAPEKPQTGRFKSVDGGGVMDTATGEYVIAPETGGVSNLTPAQKAADETFAKDYAASVLGGGYADSRRNLAQVKDVLSDLQDPEGPNLTGPLLGSTPDFITKFTHPKAIDARERVEEVVQRNLRQILGAQFTENEGERLISRAYNPRLPEAVNAERLGRLVEVMEAAYEAKMAAARHYEQYGTLSNYPGSTRVTVEDLEAAIDGDKDQSRLSQGDPVQVTTQQERDALPPGTQYIAPDRSIRIKQ